MRVITGTARGRKLVTVEGTEVVRPTTDGVKEAIFSAIQFEIEGRTVLDLFAGSGQLGIEALSRGAAKAVFIDSSREAVDIILKNAAKTRLKDRCSVSATDLISLGEFSASDVTAVSGSIEITIITAIKATKNLLVFIVLSPFVVKSNNDHVEAVVLSFTPSSSSINFGLPFV